MSIIDTLKSRFCLFVIFYNSIRRYLRWIRTESKIRMRFPNLKFETHVRFDVSTLDSLVIGRDVVIDPFSEVIVLHECPESTIPGRLTIGDHVHIGSHANLRAAGGSINIGANCLLAQHVSVIASNHAMRDEQLFVKQKWRTDKTGVALGCGVWVGAGAIILPGVTIGDNAIIGAGAIVTRSVPANEVWAGNPARKISGSR